MFVIVPIPVLAARPVRSAAKFTDTEDPGPVAMVNGSVFRYVNPFSFETVTSPGLNVQPPPLGICEGN